jgi:hypothetical protein
MRLLLTISFFTIWCTSELLIFVNEVVCSHPAGRLQGLVLLAPGWSPPSSGAPAPTGLVGPRMVGLVWLGYHLSYHRFLFTELLVPS